MLCNQLYIIRNINIFILLLLNKERRQTFDDLCLFTVLFVFTVYMWSVGHEHIMYNVKSVCVTIMKLQLWTCITQHERKYNIKLSWWLLCLFPSGWRIKNIPFGYKRSKITCAQQTFGPCKQELHRKWSKNRDRDERERKNVWVD